MRPTSLPPAASRRRGAALLLALALAVGVLFAAPAQADSRGYYFSRIGSEQGLGQNAITALAQDPRGFIWIGTQGGLHRFDGQRYVPFRHDPRDPAGLPESFVTALALEGEHSLWIGLYSQYLARLDLGSGRIERFDGRADDAPGRAAREVRALLPHGGQLWVGTLDGLERFDPATARRTSVLRLDPAQTRNAPHQQLLADDEGRVWYASPAGLHRLEPDGRAQAIGPPGAARALLRDQAGGLWVGRQDGLYRVVAGARLERAWPLPGAELPAADVRTLAQAPDGALWLGVAGPGLHRYDPAAGRSAPVLEIQAGATRLPDHSVSAMLVDHGGMLWIGSHIRGVAVTDPLGTRFRYIRDLTSPGSAEAAHHSLRAIHQGADGQLWIATDGASLLRYDPDTDRFEDWTASVPPAEAGQRRRIWAIADAGRGRLWLAGAGGLLLADPGAGRFQTVDLGAFSDVLVRSLLVDRQGDLWLGTHGHGALHYRARDGRVSHYGPDQAGPRRLGHTVVHALLEDRRGRIWFGTGGGLDQLDPATGELRHFRHAPDDFRSLAGNLVRALHEGADGSIWVGTHTGLSRVVEDANGGIGFLHPLSEALASQAVPVVFSIARSPADPPDRLWLGTDMGVVRFDIGAARAHAYGIADGLQDLEFNGGASTVLADGRIAMGGVQGLNLFDPAHLQDSTYAPPVRLLAAHTGAAMPGRNELLWDPRTLEVPGDADMLRLRIGVLDYAPAARIRYRYRLDGFDRGWIDNGAHGEVTYTRLPPGRYTLRAQATNRDGVWSGQELRLPVKVAPPWWRHPLTLAAVAALLLGVIALLVRAWRDRRRHEQQWLGQIREREERLKLALWASGEQFWNYDLARRELFRLHVPQLANAQPEITIESRITEDPDFVHPDDMPLVVRAMRAHLRGDSPLFTSEHRTRDPASGDWRWVRARGRVVERGPDSRALRVAGTARDITASRSAERERRIASAVLRSMAEAVAVFDHEFRFISVNPAFSRITGYGEGEVLGARTSLLDSGRHSSGHYLHMREQLRREGIWTGEMWQRRKDGSDFLCELQASAVHDHNDQIGHFVAVLGDITEQKRAEQELRYLANYDPLTGLPNRTLLSDRLHQAIADARLHGRGVAVLFLDLDHFKDINDTLGHAAGDRILRAAAQRLQQAVGVRHTVARLSGDEFTVVLHDLVDPATAEAMAHAVLEAFEAPLDVGPDLDITVSPSIGVSLFPDDGQTPSDLIKRADAAMYQAKAIGRRAFVRYSDRMELEIRRRTLVSGALRRVLERDELSLAFQPRQSLHDGRLSGVEALLRWHSPEHGEIPPTQFIPLAEETGLILEIGEWALRQACGVWMDWRRQGVEPPPVAVNVSSLQLLRGNLPELVARVLADTGTPAHALELELTESVVMANPAQTAQALASIRALGVSLAIDDFGTGYSSLAYLKRLPITTLKIDREFIADLGHDPEDAAITSTIIAMGHSLGLKVVAEGVETAEQLQFLRAHGCDEIQGFRVARPMPAPACLALIRERAGAPLRA